MRVLLLGVGAVGARTARQLVEAADVDEVVIAGGSAARREAVVASTGEKALDGGEAGEVTAAARKARASRRRRARKARAAGKPAPPAPQGRPDRSGEIDVVVLAGPTGTHVEAARQHLALGRAVVSCADGMDDVSELLDLDAEASVRGVPVVVGAGFSPGLSCLLARHAAARFDAVTEIHVARMGTGGPACARQHHRALAGTALDWRDGGWQRRPAGSGRELCWFPEPIGARDCYRAELPDALLLRPWFGGVERVTARLAASRRDRLTTHLPMLRKPHPEGLVGAVRVEVRGRRDGAHDVVVLGALDRPAVASGAVAALAARWAAAGKVPAGAAGLASLEDPLPLLRELATVGIKAATFEGTT